MTGPGREAGLGAEQGRVPSARQGSPPGGERRKYNRRAPVSDVTPPYFETFERIAVALERIERLLPEEQDPVDASREQSGRREQSGSAAQALPGKGSR